MIATIPELNEIVERLAPEAKPANAPAAPRLKAKEHAPTAGRPRPPKHRAASIFRELLW